jgi:hypothetical protein
MPRAQGTRGYYRIPTKSPANRIDGPLAEAVRAKFAVGWPKARIAREFRLNRRTVIRICASANRPSELPTPSLEPASSPTVRCIGCGITIRRSILRAHWPNCPTVREGQLLLKDCPI